jgi:UDP-N-acetylmuramoylalanine--D-glutamate ligase
MTSSPKLFDRTSALLASPAGHRVVVVGAGKTGAAAARVLLKLGALVDVVDDAAEDNVVAGLTKHGLNVDAAVAADTLRVSAGGIDATVVAAADLVVLSPGVPRAHPSIAPALAAQKPCVNEIEVAAAFLAKRGFKPKVIGITGTNGKSTTTTMCGAIARAFDPHAFVGGNLGTPYCQAALDVLDGKPAPKIAVLELSSYQLETIAHLKFAAAVVTNLTPDHLDRYPSAAAYYAAKARILALVDDDGGIALNASDPETALHLDPLAGAWQGIRARSDFDISSGVDGIAIVDGPARRLVVFRGGHAQRRVAGVVPLTNPNIVGHHNRQNAAAAVAGALLAGIPPESWRRGIAAYAGIAHRLERVGEKRGVAWFNDSKGTNVDATVTAVKSFAGGIHLIAGGRGKGAPYAPLVDVSVGKVVAVYTIGEDAPAIASAYHAFSSIEVMPCRTLDVACAAAAKRAQPGEVILLSPACASFDQFRDYAHRGETFRALFASSSEGSR